MQVAVTVVLARGCGFEQWPPLRVECTAEQARLMRWSTVRIPTRHSGLRRLRDWISAKKHEAERLVSALLMDQHTGPFYDLWVVLKVERVKALKPAVTCMSRPPWRR